MQVGDLVRSKWLNEQHFGVLTKCTYDIGCRYWQVRWFGECVFSAHTLEDEDDLEVICE